MRSHLREHDAGDEATDKVTAPGFKFPQVDASAEHMPIILSELWDEIQIGIVMMHEANCLRPRDRAISVSGGIGHGVSGD